MLTKRALVNRSPRSLITTRLHKLRNSAGFCVQSASVNDKRRGRRPLAGSPFALAGHLSDLNTIESKTARASLVSSGLIDSWNWTTQYIARWPFRSTTR